MNVEKKQKYILCYNITTTILAFLAVCLAIFDLIGKIPAAHYPFYKACDLFILLLFVVDYVVRFWFATDKRYFFRHNLCDLIAIIPFTSLFRGFRLARLFRMIKLLRLAVYVRRLEKKAETFLQTNGFIYIFYATMSCILLGSVCIYFIERGITIHSYPDAIWWAFVTTTTVGYGDISPATGLCRVVAAVLMIIGIGFISMLTGTIATYFLNKRVPYEKDDTKVLDLSALTNEQFQMVKEFSDYLHKKNHPHNK